jgi:hypothetical protein
MTLVYLLLKYTTESGWCYLRLRREGPADFRAAMHYGLVRLLIGRGVSLILLGTLAHELPEGALYFVLILLRWPVWALMDEWIGRRRLRLRAALGGADARSTAWRVGGVVMSSLTDLPPLLFGKWVGELWG